MNRLALLLLLLTACGASVDRASPPQPDNPDGCYVEPAMHQCDYLGTSAMPMRCDAPQSVPFVAYCMPIAVDSGDTTGAEWCCSNETKIGAREPLPCGPAYSDCDRDTTAVQSCDGSECTCESSTQPLIACPEQQPCSQRQQPAKASGCGDSTYLICPPGAEPPKGSTSGADQQLWCLP